MKNGSVKAAVKQYQSQAAIVDDRLFAKVTLRVKGASLEELCKQLSAQTRVAVSSSRGMQDEKVTVFVRTIRRGTCCGP